MGEKQGGPLASKVTYRSKRGMLEQKDQGGRLPLPGVQTPVRGKSDAHWSLSSQPPQREPSGQELWRVERGQGMYLAETEAGPGKHCSRAITYLCHR